MITRTVTIRVSSDVGVANAEEHRHRCRWLCLVEMRGLYLVAHRRSGIMIPGSAFVTYDRALECMDFALEHEFKFWETAVDRGQRRGLWSLDSSEDPPESVYHFWDWVDLRYQEYDL